MLGPGRKPRGPGAGSSSNDLSSAAERQSNLYPGACPLGKALSVGSGGNRGDRGGCVGSKAPKKAQEGEELKIRFT